MDGQLQQLIDAIGALTPRIPVSVALWDADTIAHYLNRSRRTVLSGVVTLPGFTHAIRLPSDTGSSPPDQPCARRAR